MVTCQSPGQFGEALILLVAKNYKVYGCQVNNVQLSDISGGIFLKN